jgi:hypothetical protein
MGLAVHGFHDAHQGIVPAHLTGRGHLAWMALLMPYLELDSLAELVDTERTWYVIPDHVVEQQISLFYCPSRARSVWLSLNSNSRYGFRHPNGGALSDYAMNAGDGSVYAWWEYSRVGASNGVATRPDRSTGVTITSNTRDPIFRGWELLLSFDDITDGLSNTLLVGEKSVHPQHQGDTRWGDGTFWSGDLHPPTARVAGPGYPLAQSDTDEAVLPDPISMPFGGPHPSSDCQFARCDGSVLALSPSINTTTLGYLANRHDSGIIPSDELGQ